MVMPLSIMAAACWSEMPSGSFSKPVGGHHPHFGIGTWRSAGIGDAIARLDVRDALAHGFDDAGCFAAQTARQRQRIEAGAVVGVDEVHADGGVADAGLTFAGLADRNLLPLQDLGATGLVQTDGFGHGVTPSSTGIGKQITGPALFPVERSLGF